MTRDLIALTDVLARTDSRVRIGERAAAQVWPTGFSPLDDCLSGGLRAGELVLIGGPQGLGKTTFAVQLLRHVVATGGSGIYFSYEHDEEAFLERMLTQEAYAAAGAQAPPLRDLRARLEQGERQAEGGMLELLGDLPGGPQAIATVQGYGKRLAVHRSSSRTTSVDVVRELVLTAVASGDRPVVVVDYLQKVSVPIPGLSEDDRVTRVVEALKDLALEAGVPVVAVVAAGTEGIRPGHRLRVHELRGSTALAYEADVILLLNEKYEIVARHHLLYDTRSAEAFRQVVVVTLEKNRSGRDGIEVEFRKEFDFSRFDPLGSYVSEQLVDERAQRE